MTRTPETPRESREPRKSRKALLFEATFKFYEANPEALRRVCDILLKRAIDDDTRRVLSLRVIEYFLSSYLKKRPDEQIETSVGTKRASEIARLYKAHLKAYSKREFDLFCREGRREIKIGNVTVRSNEPQLNLFYFLQKHNLIHVITQKFDEINRVRAESRNEVKA